MGHFSLISRQFLFKKQLIAQLCKQSSLLLVQLCSSTVFCKNGQEVGNTIRDKLPDESAVRSDGALLPSQSTGKGAGTVASRAYILYNANYYLSSVAVDWKTFEVAGETKDFHCSQTLFCATYIESFSRPTRPFHLDPGFFLLPYWAFGSCPFRPGLRLHLYSQYLLRRLCYCPKRLHGEHE